MAAKEQFVPFVPRGSTVPVTANNAVGNFAPMTPPPEKSKALTGAPHPASHGAPQITLQREGGQVVRICIECSCGQRIELDCLY